MATQPHNPFVLPGFGQTGDAAQNPLMASMEMMRQAWQGLAGAGGFDASKITPTMSLEDFDRRISDLRAVENWLRLNQSMLSSTIQALEVQRATIATIKSFATSGANFAGAAMPTSNAPDSSGSPGSEAGPSNESVDAYAAQATAAAQGWWDMLQQQFDNLATATTATLQGAETMRNAAQESAGADFQSQQGAGAARSARKTAARKSPSKSASAKRGSS
jgi:hypothetical protein